MTKIQISKEEMCGNNDSSSEILMIMPSQVQWQKAAEACQRYGGKLHVDKSEESVRNRTVPLIHKGERVGPDRCKRIWLGASDIEEEGVWRHPDGEILDLSNIWNTGQPNGVRVQNCVGIWETVITVHLLLELTNIL